MEENQSGFNILLGRGKTPFNHEGNQWFRGFIASKVRKYMDLETKNQKTLMVDSEYAAILKAGGRFMEYDSTINDWVPVSHMHARAKVGHALRDAGTLRLKKPRSRAKEGDKRCKDQKLEYGSIIHDSFQSNRELNTYFLVENKIAPLDVQLDQHVPQESDAVNSMLEWQALDIGSLPSAQICARIHNEPEARILGHELEQMVSSDSTSNVANFLKSDSIILPAEIHLPNEDSRYNGETELRNAPSHSDAIVDAASLNWVDNLARGDLSVESIDTRIFDND